MRPQAIVETLDDWGPEHLVALIALIAHPGASLVNVTTLLSHGLPATMDDVQRLRAAVGKH